MKNGPSFATMAATLALLISIGTATGRLGTVLAGPEATIGSAFTYQGRLDKDSAPASGNFDFQFALFDAVTGGSQIGSTIVAKSVPVSNGVFTVVLDFGRVFWEGQRFLEVSVRPVSSGGFTKLTPRQPITPAPVAAALPGVSADQAAQFVGIGRANRLMNNEVFGITANFGPAGNGYGGMVMNTNSPEGRPFYGYAAGNSVKAWTTFEPANETWDVYTNGNRRLQVGVAGLIQPGGANGLVKAGVFANCSSISPNVIRSFVNGTNAATVTWSATLQACVINFGTFDISQRYYSATANSPDARYVTCAYESNTSLYCKRWRPDGTQENGNIVVLIY
jgi:hypothetical protein